MIQADVLDSIAAAVDVWFAADPRREGFDPVEAMADVDRLIADRVLLAEALPRRPRARRSGGTGTVAAPRPRLTALDHHPAATYPADSWCGAYACNSAYARSGSRTSPDSGGITSIRGLAAVLPSTFRYRLEHRRADSRYGSPYEHDLAAKCRGTGDSPEEADYQEDTRGRRHAEHHYPDGNRSDPPLCNSPRYRASETASAI